MDTGVAIKPVAGVGQTDPVRPSIPVPTDFAPDLPGAKAVGAAPAPATTQNDAAAGNSPSAPYIARDVHIDAQSREVIYRVIDTRTRQVIRQVPDEALLRNRAYSRAIADGATPLAAQAKADIEA
jgi:hypothetical protein